MKIEGVVTAMISEYPLSTDQYNFLPCKLFDEMRCFQDLWTLDLVGIVLSTLPHS